MKENCFDVLMYKTEWRLTCNWNGSPRWMIKMLIWPYPPLEHEWAIHNQDYADMFRDVMEIWIQFQDLLVVLRIQGYLKMTIIKKYNGIEATVVFGLSLYTFLRFRKDQWLVYHLELEPKWEWIPILLVSTLLL